MIAWISSALIAGCSRRWQSPTTRDSRDVRRGDRSKDFIESGGRRLAWKTISNVAVKDGRLIVTPREGKPLKVRT